MPRIAAAAIAGVVDRWQTGHQVRRFDALVERSSDFIAVVTLEGLLTYVNPAALRILGLESVEAARRRALLDFVPIEKRTGARTQVWPGVLRDGRWTEQLELFNERTGTAVPLLVDWLRIDDAYSGTPMSLAAIGRNLVAKRLSEAKVKCLCKTLERRASARTARLTARNHDLQPELIEQRRVEARFRGLQLELFHAAHMSAAAQMAGVLAHELNQPLTAATNFMNAARRFRAGARTENEGDVVSDNIAEAAKQMVRAAKILGRYRAFAACREASKRVEQIPTLVAEASTVAFAGSGSLRVGFSVHCEPKAVSVVCDGIQIRQVFVNLMLNALEAMGERSDGSLGVRTTLVGSDTVEIAVSDTGPGFSDAIYGQLFEPFVATTNNRVGLGLSICRKIVEAHGGRLQAETNDGGGVTVRFTLPAAL
ncbi:MAG TPA: ATP-binding protein [Gammaproteobacteria bacterium]|nr:ATP-binding protein [Gammaproteobacteria bacterium]